MSKKDLKNLDEEIRTLESVDYSPLYSDNLTAAAYGYIATFRTDADSLNRKPFISFVSGILAGFWVGIAYIATTYASYMFPNQSVQKLIVGAIFPIVLSLLFFVGGTFLTACMSMGYPMLNGIGRYKIFFKTLSCVYIGNIVGALMIAFLMELAQVFHDPNVANYVYISLGLTKIFDAGKIMGENIGVLGDNAKNATQIYWSTGLTAKNISITVMTVFFSAIVCNALVLLSSQAGKSTKNNLMGPFLVFCISIFMFAISSFQHSAANWFIGAAMLFIAIMQENVSTVEGASLSVPVAVPAMFILLNIIPAIFGNYFGGLVMGFLLAAPHQAYAKLLISEYRLKLLKEERSEILEKIARKKGDYNIPPKDQTTAVGTPEGLGKDNSGNN